MTIIGVVDWEHFRSTTFDEEWRWIGDWPEGDDEFRAALRQELARYNIVQPNGYEERSFLLDVVDSVKSICFFASTWWDRHYKDEPFIGNIDEMVFQESAKAAKHLTDILSEFYMYQNCLSGQINR